MMENYADIHLEKHRSKLRICWNMNITNSFESQLSVCCSPSLCYSIPCFSSNLCKYLTYFSHLFGLSCDIKREEKNKFTHENSSVEISFTSCYSVHVCGSYLIRCWKLLSNSNYLIYISIVLPLSPSSRNIFSPRSRILCSPFPQNFFLHDLSLKTPKRKKLSASMFVRKMVCGVETRHEVWFLCM